MNCALSDKGCGGCRDLKCAYGESLKNKENRIRALYPDCEKILGAEKPVHYRNKVLRSFANGKQKLYAGFYREGTHQILSVKDCLLEDETASRIAFDAAEILADLGCDAYREDFHKGTVRHMIIRRAFHTGDCLLTIVTGTEDFSMGTEFAARISRKYPCIKGVIQNLNPRNSSAVLGFRDRLLFGKDEIWDEMCGLDVCLNSRSFYQVNTPQAEKLYEIAVRNAALTKEDRVLDAYSGVGVIGMCAAMRAGQVTGIEIVKPAVECARKAARKNGIENISFLCGDVLQALRDENAHYTCVFVDPPRAGCSAEFISALVNHAPERIVYISCFPDTLKRDTNYLEANGYTLQAVKPVDMFPYTEHVETITLMSRINK